MRSARIPADVLAVEIRSGHVTVGGLGGSHAMGAIGAVASQMAASGLKKAGDVPGAASGLRFPPNCCNCLASGPQVRSVESLSIVNRGVPYSFKFRIGHCVACADTADRKRPGAMGLVAAFLAIAVPVSIVALGVGMAYEIQSLIVGSLLIGPAMGIAVPWLWLRMRRPRPGQVTRYQAVYASAIDVDMSGMPKGFTMSFENDAFGDRFVAMNRDLRVVAG
jgi:hypothetical protein